MRGFPSSLPEYFCLLHQGHQLLVPQGAEICLQTQSPASWTASGKPPMLFPSCCFNWDTTRGGIRIFLVYFLHLHNFLLNTASSTEKSLLLLLLLQKTSSTPHKTTTSWTSILWSIPPKHYSLLPTPLFSLLRVIKYRSSFNSWNTASAHRENVMKTLPL